MLRQCSSLKSHFLKNLFVLFVLGRLSDVGKQVITATFAPTKGGCARQCFDRPLWSLLIRAKRRRKEQKHQCNNTCGGVCNISWDVCVYVCACACVCMLRPPSKQLLMFLLRFIPVSQTTPYKNVLRIFFCYTTVALFCRVSVVSKSLSFPTDFF